MSRTESSPIIAFCYRNRLLILAPVCVCLVLAAWASYNTPRKWKATQTMVVRDDLLGESFKPGRFPSQESLKNAQETILHISREPVVISAALRETYPENAKQKNWPTLSQIEAMRENVSISAPNGAEFGKTDVIILSVKVPEPDKAPEFAASLARETEKMVRVFRTDSLKSMESELRLQYEQSRKEYLAIADRVQAMIDEAGIDLDSLRAMSDTGGSSELNRGLEQIRSELRNAAQENELATKQLELLRQANHGSLELLPTSGELLQMQPILKKLVDGLIDAKLKYSFECSNLLDDHPKLIASKNAILITQQQLAEQIESIESGLRSQQQLAKSKLDYCAAEEAKYVSRLLAVNNKRVEYQMLANELAKRGESMSKLQNNLSEVTSLAESADRVSLVAIIGAPVVGNSPVGLSKSWIILSGLIGGLLIGFGLAIVTNDPKLWGSVAVYLKPVTQTVNELRSRMKTDETPNQTAEQSRRAFGSGSTTTPYMRPAEILKSSDIVMAPVATDTQLAAAMQKVTAANENKPSAKKVYSQATVIDFPTTKPREAVDSGPRATPTRDPLDRSESNETKSSSAHQDRSKNTVDLKQLHRLLSGRNAAAAMETEPLSPRPESKSAEPASETGRNQKDLKERLGNLSKSITAYCQSVKKKT